MQSNLGSKSNTSSQALKPHVILQGECFVSAEPNIEMTTLLGSCVATCLFDERAGVGGMNHFLLPDGAAGNRNGQKYGLHAMEVLINSMLKIGAKRDRISAKVFGGARMADFGGAIGEKNVEFAMSFLEQERIPCIASSTGGTLARRLKFHSATGRASQRLVFEEVQIKAESPSSGGVHFFD